MEQFEKVEKLREKAGISYEEARKALEENNWDLLEAIVALENQGKIKGPDMQTYSTRQGASGEFTQASQNYEKQCHETSMGEILDKCFRWCGKVIKKACDNYFEVRKNGKNIISVPIIILVIMLIFAFWVTLPLLIVGLFCGFKYYFQGEAKVTVDFNDVCDKAAKTCETIKNDLSDKKEE